MQLEWIRPRDGQVISQVAALEAAIFSDAWSENNILETVKHGQSICVAAVEADRILGYFLCYYVLDECEIARIAVAEDVRRKGVGDALFSYLLDVCQEKSLERILLEVRAGNQPAIAFYKKNGFETDGIRKGYYAGWEPEDAVLMSRNV